MNGTINVAQATLFLDTVGTTGVVHASNGTIIKGIAAEYPSITVNGTIEVSGAVTIATSTTIGGSGQIKLDDGATLSLQSASTADIVFGTGSTLALTASSVTPGTVGGYLRSFGAGDSVTFVGRGPINNLSTVDTNGITTVFASGAGARLRRSG